MATNISTEEVLDKISSRTGIPYETLDQYKSRPLRCCGRKKLKEIYLCGIPFLDISVYFGISVPMVQTWLTFYFPNLPKRPPSASTRIHNYYTPDMQPTLERMYLAGDSVEQMAVHFEVSKVSIRKWIRKYLGHLPPRAKYHRTGSPVVQSVVRAPSATNADEFPPAFFAKYQRRYEQQMQRIMERHGTDIFEILARTRLRIWREVENLSGPAYVRAVDDRVCARCGVTPDEWRTLVLSDELQAATQTVIRSLDF